MFPRGRLIAASCTYVFGLMLVTTAASEAQTWRWTYVTSTPNSPFVAAQSTVSIAANTIHMTYTIPLQKRQVVIEACDANLHDVQDATTIRSVGTTYLVIRFKPDRSASCVNGKQSSVALPTVNRRYVSTIATAINASCCTVATGTPTPRPHPAVTGVATPAAIARAAPSTPSARPARATPSARPAAPEPRHSTPPPKPAPSTATATPGPTPAPTALPSAAAASPSPSPATTALQHWVENNGLFWFVRIRNSSRVRLTPVGDVFDCRNVDVGCGPFTPTELEPGSAATVATIASVNHDAAASFKYRFTAGDTAHVISGVGSSAATPPRSVARMSAAELRAAQADAMSRLRAPGETQATRVAQSSPARLVKRGSSRLAIGQSGTALIRLMIAANGTPEEATIVSITNKALTAAAIETAVSSTYAPAMQNGRAVAGKYVATFSFDGEDPALASVPVWKRSPSPAPAADTSPPPAAETSPAPAAPTSPAPAAGTAPMPLPTTLPSPAPATNPTASPAPTESQAPQIAPSQAPQPPQVAPSQVPQSPQVAPTELPSPQAVPSQTPLPGATPSARTRSEGEAAVVFSFDRRFGVGNDRVEAQEMSLFVG